MGDLTCASCGAELKAGVRFCGKCGKPAPAAAAAPAAGGVPKRTMVAFDAGGQGAVPPPPGAAPAAPAPAPAPAPQASPGGAQDAGMAKTMMGLPPGLSLPGAPAAPPAQAAPPAGQPAPQAPAQPPQAAPGPEQGGGMAKTMMGLPAGMSPPGAPAAPPAAAKPGASPPAQRGANTVMGIPSSMPPPGQPEPAAAAPPAGAPPAAAGGGRTMLGLPGQIPGQAPTGADAPAPAGGSGPDAGGAAAAAAAAAGGRTMLGVGLGGAGAPGAPAQPAADLGSTDVEFGEARSSDEETIPPVGRRSPVLGIVVGLIVVAIGVGAALWARGGGDSGVRAEVQRIGGSEAMMFEVPGAAPGSKLRFGGQEQELKAGRATFPLAADSLRVGDNAVIVDVVSPSGSVESARITLSVEYRLRVDLSPLKAGDSEVDVVASALPGSKFVLDGEELKLDAQGKGVKRVKLDVAGGAKAGHVDHKIDFRVELPSGEVSVGEHVTRVPVTMMQIDRPGLSLVTDRESVELAGAVAKDAKLTVDGEAVPVADGRFLHTLPLPEPGEYNPVIVASSAGRVPSSRTIAIQRVEDLAEAAAGFAVDESLTYAKISQNPKIYRGQKASFEGRVYAAKVEGGRSVLQMLVRECPKGRRCSLWVTYPSATEFEVNSWVRVVGTLEGEQQFRSAADEVVTVPKVSAAFLLPAKP